MSTDTDSILSELREMIREQGIQLAEQKVRTERLQAELDRQRAEKLSLAGRLAELEGGQKVSRAGLFKVAAAGAAGLVGAGVLSERETGVALADTYGSFSTSTFTDAVGTTTSGGGAGLSATTTGNGYAIVAQNNSGTSTYAIRADGGSGTALYADATGTVPAVRADGFGSDAVAASDATVLALNRRTGDLNSLPGTGVALYAETGTGIGVFASCTDDSRNVGYANGTAVKGVSAGTGVWGQSYTSGNGVVGAASGGGNGVYGTFATGETSSYHAVYGLANLGSGVGGASTSGYGVQGITKSNYGVLGNSSSSHGLGGYTAGGYGFVGQSTNNVGMRGSSINNYGAVISGGLAPIRMFPSATITGAPSTSGHLVGELFVDKNGSLYYFNGTLWKQIA